MTNGLKIDGLGIHTCNGICLEVAPGQCIGLTGASGAGKTLFLRALADLDPHKGRMWLNGVASDEMPAFQWRRKVGLLPAESAWWHDTVKPHLLNVSEQALFELGFDPQVLDWQISRLSSGERQRLALLRLLGRRPQVLLLDEPTANLDSANAARVEALLEQYLKTHQPMMVWVGHDLDQLHRICEPVYTLFEKQLKPVDGPLPQGREGK